MSKLDLSDVPKHSQFTLVATLRFPLQELHERLAGISPGVWRIDTGRFAASSLEPITEMKATAPVPEQRERGEQYLNYQLRYFCNVGPALSRIGCVPASGQGIIL